MTSAQKRPSRKVLIVLALMCNLAAIVIWVFRPRRIYAEWLGLGSPEAAMSRRVLVWLDGLEAPLTPLGFLSLFSYADLLVAIALLFALAVLILLLAMTWTEWPLLDKVRTQLHWPPPMAFRVRGTMIVIAVIALELGWEVHGWKAWRLHTGNLNKLHSLVQMQSQDQKTVQVLSKNLAQLEASTVTEPDQDRTLEAIKASRAKYLDSAKRELARMRKRIEINERLIDKYQTVVNTPGLQVEAVPPEPEQEPDARTLFMRKQYRRSLDAFKDELRQYPALWEAHTYIAWILATCPDSEIRDGRAAVESATRACQLTRWNMAFPLNSLAAAYAETGDFTAAIKWQRKAMELKDHSISRTAAQERLSLYETGQPFREGR